MCCVSLTTYICACRPLEDTLVAGHQAPGTGQIGSLLRLRCGLRLSASLAPPTAGVLPTLELLYLDEIQWMSSMRVVLECRRCVSGDPSIIHSTNSFQQLHINVPFVRVASYSRLGQKVHFVPVQPMAERTRRESERCSRVFGGARYECRTGAGLFLFTERGG